MGTHDDRSNSIGRSELLVLRRRLTQLERRVAELEAGGSLASKQRDVELDEPSNAVEPEMALQVESKFAETEPVYEAPPTDIDFVEPYSVLHDVELIDYEPQVAPPPPVAEGALEQAIGLKLAGWAGGLVVVLGAVLGVKYAYDAGWFKLLAPEVRLGLILIGGIALLGAGEFVLRRLGKPAAVGLFASGVGTLFVAAYAGYGYFGLYESAIAFVAMAAVAVVGAGVGLRAGMLSVAVLAQLGGHLAPLLLGGEADSPTPLLAFLLMMGLVAAVLSWQGGGRWTALRWVALVPTSVWVVALYVNDASETTLFVFCLLFVLPFVLEMLAGTRGEEGDAGLAAVFAVTLVAGVAGATLATFGTSGLVPAVWLVGEAAALAALSVVARRLPGRVGLYVTFVACAAILLVMSVPVAFVGVHVAVVWALMAVAFAVVGSRLQSTLARIVATLIWIVTCLYTAQRVDDDVLLSLQGVDLLTRTAVGFGLSMIGVCIAWLATTNPPKPDTFAFLKRRELFHIARCLAAASAAVWVVASLTDLPPAVATASLVVFAWLLVGVDVIVPRLRLVLVGVAVLLVALAKWVLIDQLIHRLSDGWTQLQLDYLPIFNPLTLLGAVAAGSLPAIFFLRRRNLDRVLDRTASHRDRTTTALWLAAALLAVFGLGAALEIDRIIQAARFSWPLATSPGRVHALSMTAVALLCQAALAGLILRLVKDSSDRARRFSLIALVPIVLAMKFVLYDLVLSGEGASGDLLLAILNPETAVGLVLLGTLTLHLWPVARSGPGEPGRVAAGFLVVTLLTVGVVVLSIDLWRLLDGLSVTLVTRRAAVSISWAIIALALIVFGLSRQIAALRYYGLALLAVAAAKVLIYDLASVDRGWRTLSFIAVGLLMIATSVAYATFGPRLLSRKPDEVAQ